MFSAKNALKNSSAPSPHTTFRGDDVEELDEVSLQRWLNESKTAFKVYQEKYRSTGSKQDQFDLLLKYMEIAVIQAKKRGT